MQTVSKNKKIMVILFDREENELPQTERGIVSKSTEKNKSVLKAAPERSPTTESAAD